MTPFKAEWLEHRRRRYTRPDASRYFRPDYARFLRSGHARPNGPQPYEPKYGPDPSCVSEELALAAHTSELRKLKAERDRLLLLRAAIHLEQLRRKAGFNPAQPRVPAGNPDGGEWTSDGGGINDPRVLSDESPDPVRPGAQYAATGHHYVARGVFEKEKYSFHPETLKVFENAVTGPLNDPTSNKFDKLHQEYNEAVEESLDRFLERNKIRADQMTPDQARSFTQEIKTSRDPRIFRFNKRLWMREIMYWMRRGPRGRE